MEIKSSHRTVENFHVLLWLIKDLSWAMEFKFLGTFMILPTLIAAIWILWVTRGREEFWVNMSVLFWIMANSTWMVIEFFRLGSKYYCLPFFILGFLSFAIYIYIHLNHKCTSRD